MTSDPRAFFTLDLGAATTAAALIGRIDGRWHLCGAILCISRREDDNYIPTGPVLTPGQLPQNWYYYAGDPLATYQPAPGEMVAWFVTAGAQRRGDVHTIRARSNIVVAPFRVGRFV